FFLVLGKLQILRSSFSLLKNSGKSPNSCSINSADEIGLPVGLQKDVLIIESISRTLLSDSFTFIICLGGVSQTQGMFPHSGQGSGSGLSQTQGVSPQILQGLGVPPPVGGSGSNGSPSHSGSWK